MVIGSGAPIGEPPTPRMKCTAPAGTQLEGALPSSLNSRSNSACAAASSSAVTDKVEQDRTVRFGKNARSSGPNG